DALRLLLYAEISRRMRDREQQCLVASPPSARRSDSYPNAGWQGGAAGRGVLTRFARAGRQTAIARRPESARAVSRPSTIPDTAAVARQDPFDDRNTRRSWPNTRARIPRPPFG